MRIVRERESQMSTEKKKTPLFDWHKNNGGNMIKFAKIIPADPRWNPMAAQMFMGAGILMAVLTAFSTIIQVL